MSSKSVVRAVLASIAVGAGIGAAALAAPTAQADMGNCGYGGGFGSGGGYCDGPVDQFGNQYHCETVYVLGFGGTNCFWRHVGP